MALFVPDHVRETFQPSTDHGGKDGTDRGLSYLKWTCDLDGDDTHYPVEYVHLLREGRQPTRVEHEQDICGLFPRGEWLDLLRS